MDHTVGTSAPGTETHPIPRAPACQPRPHPHTDRLLAAGCGFLGNAVTILALSSLRGLQHVLDKPPEPAWDLGAGGRGWMRGDAWWAKGAGAGGQP